MESELPRIESVTVESPSTLRLRWQGKKSASVVNLLGWIATGGDILSSLKDAAVFRKAHVAAYGGAVAWDDDGDIAIDAVHLMMLADEQKPFRNHDVQTWQDKVKVSNSEAADFLGISVSTWNSYKANAKVPQSIAMTLRCALRDPLLMQAHLRPRSAGRPRKAS
jgi:hypothetical protein